MKKVKLGLSNLSSLQLAAKAQHLVTMLTGNANFVTPNPTLVFILGLMNALLLAVEDASNGDKVKKAAERTAYTNLKNAIVLLGGYVQEASGGDETKILSSGFEVVGQRHPQSVLTAVENVHSIATNIEHQVILKWNNLKGASAYLISFAENPDGDWIIVTACTKAAITHSLNGLPIGTTKVWVKVAGVNAAGVGAYSAAISVRVL